LLALCNEQRIDGISCLNICPRVMSVVFQGDRYTIRAGNDFERDCILIENQRIGNGAIR
jgi:hypothetical protein